MPRNGSGVFSKPSGSTAVSGTTIESAKYNAVIDDLVTDANTPRPIVAGGTGATSLAGLLTTLGGQPLDAGLTSISGLTTAADKMIYTTASDTYAVADLSSFARTVLDDTSASAVRTTIGAQATDADLDALAALASTGIAVRTASNTWAQRTITSTGGTVAITNAGGVAGNINLEASPTWTFVESIDCSSGTSKDTADFEAGRDYKFVFTGVSHADATSRSVHAAFYGETASALSSAASMISTVAPTNNIYGEFDYHMPRTSRRTHVIKGLRDGSVSTVASNHANNITVSEGCYANWGTAQGVLRLRFTVTNSAAFDGGTIEVWKK